MPRTHLAPFALSTLLAACGATAEQDYAASMAREHRDDRPVASGAAEPAGGRPVVAQRVVYAVVGGQEVTGYLARPEEAMTPLPGLIVIHEWWGLNPNIEAMARRLAGEGYNALAVDLYRGRVAEAPERARELVGAVDRGAAEDNLRQAYRYLERELEAPAVGTIGWCFGGGWSLNTALLLPDQVDATVIYYGRMETDRERLAALKMPILGHFGAEDRGIPLDQVRAFEAALTALGKSAEIHVYEGADHAFANPSGTRYQQAAAEQAWERTVAFFARHLKGAGP